MIIKPLFTHFEILFGFHLTQSNSGHWCFPFFKEPNLGIIENPTSKSRHVGISHRVDAGISRFRTTTTAHDHSLIEYMSQRKNNGRDAQIQVERSGRLHLSCIKSKVHRSVGNVISERCWSVGTLGSLGKTDVGGSYPFRDTLDLINISVSC